MQRRANHTQHVVSDNEVRDVVEIDESGFKGGVINITTKGYDFKRKLKFRPFSGSRLGQHNEVELLGPYVSEAPSRIRSGKPKVGRPFSNYVPNQICASSTKTK